MRITGYIGIVLCVVFSISPRVLNAQTAGSHAKAGISVKRTPEGKTIYFKCSKGQNETFWALNETLRTIENTEHTDYQSKYTITSMTDARITFRDENPAWLFEYANIGEDDGSKDAVLIEFFIDRVTGTMEVMGIDKNGRRLRGIRPLTCVLTTRQF